MFLSTKQKVKQSVSQAPWKKLARTNITDESPQTVLWFPHGNSLLKLFVEEDTEPEKRRGPQGFSRPVKFTRTNECCYNKWCNKIWFIRRTSTVLNSVKLNAAEMRLSIDKSYLCRRINTVGYVGQRKMLEYSIWQT